MRDLISNFDGNIDLGGDYSCQVPFYASGMNIPNWITLDNTQTRSYIAGMMNFISRNYGEMSSEPISFSYEVKQIPTTIIVVFNPPEAGAQTREVKVNSELVLDFSNADNIEKTRYGQNKYYLFYNQNGGISLAAPNFAGNVVTAEETKIMIEYTITSWEDVGR